MPSFAVWSEFTPYSALHASLDQLRRSDCALYLAVHEEDLHDRGLYGLMKEAKALGVEVRPWPLLSKEKGYWPNRWNLGEFKEMVLRFLGECRKEGVPPDWIVLDIEPHLGLMLELERLLWEKRFFRARDLLRAWDRRGPSGNMQDLVGAIHDQGVRVHAVTLPMVLDDMRSGKGRLQRYLGVPIEGVSWDEISFMVYRPYFWDHLKGTSADIVESYGRDAKWFFQERASLALGPIGHFGVTQSPHYFQRPEQVHEDIDAGRRAGIERFSLFCLEGMEAQGHRALSGPGTQTGPSMGLADRRHKNGGQMGTATS